MADSTSPEGELPPVRRAAYDAAVSSPRYLFLTGSLAFLSIGALQAVYGPAFPQLRQSFGVGAAQVGLVVSLHFAGAVIAILLLGMLLTRFGYHRILGVSGLFMTAGCAVMAAGASWEVLLLGAFVAGLGFGGLDIGLNVLFAQGFGERSAAALNLLNASFGLGAILGPLLVAAFLPLGFRGPLLVMALVSGLLTLLLFGVRPAAQPAGAGTQTSGLVSLLGFILLYFFYVGGEVGTASWQATHLAPSYGEANAALLTSLFWAALTVGRLLAAPLSLVLRPPTLVLGAAGLAFLSLLLSHSLELAPYAYTLTGLFLAPVFPTGLVWLRQTFPRRAAGATAIVVASASFGAVVFPPLIGVAVEFGGGALIPSSLAAVASVCLLSAALLWWFKR
jgi:fucose permease